MGLKAQISKIYPRNFKQYINVNWRKIKKHIFLVDKHQEGRTVFDTPMQTVSPNP